MHRQFSVFSPPEKFDEAEIFSLSLTYTLSLVILHAIFMCSVCAGSRHFFYVFFYFSRATNREKTCAHVRVRSVRVRERLSLSSGPDASPLKRVTLDVSSTRRLWPNLKAHTPSSGALSGVRMTSYWNRW